MKTALGCLLLLFGVIGLTYSLVTPVFEAPDEVWHYAYVRYLAEERALPALIGDASGAHQEVAQPPLYYAVAALVSGLASDDDLPDLMWHNPGFGYQAGGAVNDNKNMLIHTGRERFPWRGAVLAVRLARFVSLGFGLLTVWATWGLGREAFPQRLALALGAAAAVAFHPQFLFISGVTSNDSAAAALSTAALWAIARAANRGITFRRSLAIGLLLGLAAMTKTSALLLVPLAAITLILASRQASLGIGHWALVIVPAFAVGGWWYLRNALLYGDPFGFRVHADTPWGRPAPASLDTLIAEMPRLYRSFWGAFGWGHVELPAWVYLALGAILLASLIGWGGALMTRRTTGRGRILLLALAWWMLVLVALLQWMRQVQAPHGRLLFPAIGAFAVLLVGGWASLPRPRLTLTLSPCFLAPLSLLIPWTTIRPAFAPPRLLPPAEAAATVLGADLIFDDAARLLGVALDRPSVAPGDTLTVRACWEAKAPMTQDYTVFLHLVGRDDARVAERYTYPGLGSFPTSLWPTGQAFCDLYRVRVEEWTPVPELYDLVIGLYDAPTGERLPACYPDGTADGFPALTQVRVAPEQPLTVSPQYPLDYQLGEEIALIGYDLSEPLQGGDLLTVTLYWRADALPQGDYTAFVHLLDDAGQLLAQHDGPPRYGRYPTPAWHPGDVIPDEHILAIPALAAGQRVRLVAGMYNSDTLERLPVAGFDGLLPYDLVPLPADIP
ncbi:MAG TPA: DUF2142 domain-containing protein [Thermoflexia bacterium]|nr:DUF2142 domain-containing protein [Thermoflexia bacterium]